MGLRPIAKRWLSPTVFALVALAFLLPFATVSGGSARTALTGIQLVTRTVPHGGRPGTSETGCAFNTEIGRCVERQAAWVAELALAAALLGLALGLLGIQRGPGWCAAVGVVTMAFLYLTSGYAGVDVHSGYVSILLLFVWAGLLHARRAHRRGEDAHGYKPRRSGGFPRLPP